MKALVVVNLAGFLTFLWNDIQTLQDLGYEVSVAMNSKMKDGSDAIEVEQLNSMGIKWYHIEFDSKSPISRTNIKAYTQLKKVLNDYYDLIHCHTPIAGLLTRFAASKQRKRHTKVLYTTHGFAFTDRSRKKDWIVYFTAEYIASLFCDAIITINHEDYNNAKRMRCKNVFIINGVGVKTNRFKNVNVDKELFRSKLGIAKDDIMVLSVGELSARKNHIVVLQALRLTSNKEKYVFVICGREVVDSGITCQLTEYAKSNDLRLVLAGHRGDIPEMNNCADIAVIPSIREGLGLAGIEALASGIPVIGSDVQGIREYVIDGVNGYMCDPYAPEEFAKALEKISAFAIDEKICIRENCYQSAKAYDFTVSKEQMKNIYKHLIT